MYIGNTLNETYDNHYAISAEIADHAEHLRAFARRYSSILELGEVEGFLFRYPGSRILKKSTVGAGLTILERV